MDLLLFSDDTLRRGIRELTTVVEVKNKTVGTATRWAYCFCTRCGKQVGDSGGAKSTDFSCSSYADSVPVSMLKCTILTVAQLTAIRSPPLLTACEDYSK